MRRTIGLGGIFAAISGTMAYAVAPLWSAGLVFAISLWYLWPQAA